MKLAIDIGNTSVTCGLFQNKSIIQKFNINSIDQLQKNLENINPNKIEKIIVSSVVPKLTKNFNHYFKKTYQCKVNFIHYTNIQLSLKVKKPETVGNDRLCNIFATIKLYKTPAIIVDFGTATTYDVINVNNEFIGGAIGSGIETSANYLINKAALLFTTDLKFPKHVIGTDTKENIQSGIMYGALDQVKGMILRIKKEHNANYKIILTGGFSKLLSPFLSIKHKLDVDLTLKGMVLIDESNS